MADDIKMKLSLEPEVDLSKLSKTMQDLGNRLRRASPIKGHKVLSDDLTDVFEKMMATGKFASTTGAARYFRKITGDKYAPRQDAVIIQSESTARKRYNERQLEERRVRAIESRFDLFKEDYKTFLENGKRKEDRDSLYKQFTKLDKDVNLFANEYKKTGRKIPEGIKNVNNSLKGMGAGLKGAGGGSGAGMKAGGWVAAVVEAIKTVFKLAAPALASGSAELAEQAMYGPNRDITLTQTLGNLFNIDEKTVANPHQYALMFRQRMITGQTSNEEFYALNRMGDLGRMIASGEAAKNPEKFYSGLIKYIRENKGNEAEVMQNFQWLKWNPEIMKLGALEFSDKQFEQAYGAWQEIVAKRKWAETSMRPVSAWWSRLGPEFGSATANMIGTHANMVVSPYVFPSENLAGFSPKERAYIDKNVKVRSTLDTWGLWAGGSTLHADVTGTTPENIVAGWMGLAYDKDDKKGKTLQIDTLNLNLTSPNSSESFEVIKQGLEEEAEYRTRYNNTFNTTMSNQNEITGGAN